MGCSSEKHVETKEVSKNQNNSKNIEPNKEPEKALNKKEENEKETNEEILYLEYETSTDNENIRLFGNDVDEFDDYTLPFYERENNKFDLYDNNGNKINNFIYAFEKSGIHKIKMIIKEKITDFSYMFYDCNKLKGITGYIDTSNIESFFWLFKLFFLSRY